MIEKTDLMCSWCEEPILPEEQLQQRTPLIQMHQECAVRAVFGSLAHLQKRCSCFDDNKSDEDLPGMTRRDAAKMAFIEFCPRPLGERSPKERAKMRPSNFATLSHGEQWYIDKRLGILDWKGD